MPFYTISVHYYNPEIRNPFVPSFQSEKLYPPGKCNSAILSCFNPQSQHCADEAQMLVRGTFKNMLFYKEDVLKQIATKYHQEE